MVVIVAALDDCTISLTKEGCAPSAGQILETAGHDAHTEQGQAHSAED